MWKGWNCVKVNVTNPRAYVPSTRRNEVTKVDRAISFYINLYLVMRMEQYDTYDIEISFNRERNLLIFL